MDTRYLEYILVLAETGNITRAAKKLYISQPTLSQFLSKQEAEIGHPLFERNKGIYTLTYVGELYAEYARKVLFLTDTLEKDLKRSTLSNHIKISTSSSKSRQLLTTILAEFNQQFPYISITMSDGPVQELNLALQRGEIDIAIVSAPTLEIYNHNCTELKQEEILFASPSIHPYCMSLPPNSKHQLTAPTLLSHFGSDSFLLPQDGSCIKTLINNFFYSCDTFHPSIPCSTNHVQSIFDLVSSNMGVGFIPSDYATPLPSITYFSLEPKMYRIHAIAYRKDLTLSAPYKFLIALAQSYASTHWADVF